jgi:4-hydroxy-tetrahydrodipicolinate synthase
MISGSLVALVTPMLAAGGIDWDALGALIAWHIEQGSSGIVAVGTTGESATLTVPEHCDLIRYTVEQVAGAVPVIAGTGANSTTEAIELTSAASKVGADACLLVTPYYNKPSQEGLYQHYRKIADSVAIPQILYNVPGRTGVDMLPGTVARLADIDNITGIKEATGDLQRGREVLDICAGKMAVYSGDDATATELMLMGAAGSISVTANVAPALLAQLCQKATAGETDAARSLDSRIVALNAALFLESNPIPVKWALAHMGRIGPGIRLPLTELAEQYREPLRAAMSEAGIL